eukprot:CAMPEP_0118674978 /NCGR_PEP_ID=MMETSP0800-20121206/1187_1 /TAXON_ID=210618 ORGANISM="Striatella unipunctata, Strain CCMP2910" /NCGR_SAMPLE_ID=MMETSP0800 /ASSEMBLY_ACC=CAM_ASM_000638 /LENGTH=720 /DNA_ID=CAMNT_0006570231 /DNA_START=30 /DNA_END=2192 /DNA_ORIENTATION=-
MVSSLKFIAAALFLMSALSTWLNSNASQHDAAIRTHRRLAEIEPVGDSVPSYMNELMDDLTARNKLMDETPPAEVKYWFEFSGPLQKYFYRYSRSRGKADYFEGRDDSGVISSRFVEETAGGKDYSDFFGNKGEDYSEASMRNRLLENCIAMGSPIRPDMSKDSIWYDWYATSAGTVADRCRILVTLNTVGAGRGTVMLWETNPPQLNAQGPEPWMSEQETAATHLERNLREMDAMCETGQIALRLQVLVCEPIPGKWTDWIDSLLVNCGGKAAPNDGRHGLDNGVAVEDRPSPVQVVVVASAATADTCHDLKSGFMEKRMQDLVLAPPYLNKNGSKDPSIKTTHPDLVTSDDYDVYVAMKWSSLVTLRSVNSFLQASADLAAAAASPDNVKAVLEKSVDGSSVAISNAPSSPFLIPSFVRVSYVSEENSKVAKWRMHGDFFHPAAWEICKDSFDMAWIPDSLSGAGGVNGICYNHDGIEAARVLPESEHCGQWWVYMAEEQMSTTPEVYANEATPSVVQGASNHIWMVTERQRREIVKQLICHNDKEESCGEMPQAVLPLGDLESFLINFTPNTALGKKHNKGRRPGYSREKEHAMDREKVRERKQLKDQEDIEKALFDYTIYPAALFHKDATIKAARVRDELLTKHRDHDKAGPQTVKSSYYDVTITKPRQATLGWCQAIARKGLCTLYADYFRTSTDHRCMEACGMKMNWTPIQKEK